MHVGAVIMEFRVVSFSVKFHAFSTSQRTSNVIIMSSLKEDSIQNTNFIINLPQDLGFEVDFNKSFFFPEIKVTELIYSTLIFNDQIQMSTINFEEISYNLPTGKMHLFNYFHMSFLIKVNCITDKWKLPKLKHFMQNQAI